MTVKEAIKIIGSDYEFCGSEEMIAIDMAINALEVKDETQQKQEAKKPRKNDGETGLMFWKMQTYTCPSCGNVCLTQWMNERNKLNYCWNCGQRINWEGIANE